MSLKILVVDDSAVERENLKGLLSGKGYSVLTAENGETGVATAVQESPDLILMDVVMPGKSGFETCREIKRTSSTKNIPIIMVTSKNQRADKVMGELQGASGHIGKPYDENEILTEVAKFH